MRLSPVLGRAVLVLVTLRLEPGPEHVGGRAQVAIRPAATLNRSRSCNLPRSPPVASSSVIEGIETFWGVAMSHDLTGVRSWPVAWHWEPGQSLAGTLGDAGVAGASATNGPGRNGISTAKPKKGGSVTFGIDTEESGFDPSTARWDEGGFLYGRTVFDPLAIVTASGKVEPYLAESITSNDDYTSFTITLRPNILFHDGTPLDAAALLLNIENTAKGVLTGPAFADFSSATVTGPLAVTITMKNPWVPFPYYLAEAQTGYIAAPSMLNNTQRRHLEPDRHRTVRLPGLGPQQPLTATRNPHYWRKGYPYLDSITYKPIINPRIARRRARRRARST